MTEKTLFAVVKESNNQPIQLVIEDKKHRSLHLAKYQIKLSKTEPSYFTSEMLKFDPNLIGKTTVKIGKTVKTLPIYLYLDHKS